MFTANGIVRTETEVFEAHVSNIGRVMLEKLNNLFGPLESAAWLIIAFSVIAVMAYTVVRWWKSRDSNLPVQI